MKLANTDKEFYGIYAEQMPLLIAEGRTPLTVAQVMERKLNSSREVRPSYIDNNFYTGDAIVYNPNRRFKVGLDSQDLRGINPKSNLKRNGTLVPTRQYDTIDAQEFARDELILGRPLTAEEARTHPVWRTLAKDQNLLNEFVEFIFKEAKKQFNYDQNMGIYLANPENVPTVGAWCVYWLSGRSGAGGGGHLGDGGSRLVGVAPEAQVSETLEDKLEVLQEGQAIRFRGRTYVLAPSETLK